MQLTNKGDFLGTRKGAREKKSRKETLPEKLIRKKGSPREKKRGPKKRNRRLTKFRKRNKDDEGVKQE